MNNLKITGIVVGILAVLIIVPVKSCEPIKNFYREQDKLDAETRGKMILLEAESSKKAMIEEAKAKNEAATLDAEAKVKIAKRKLKRK